MNDDEIIFRRTRFQSCFSIAGIFLSTVESLFCLSCHVIFCLLSQSSSLLPKITARTLSNMFHNHCHTLSCWAVIVGSMIFSMIGLLAGYWIGIDKRVRGFLDGCIGGWSSGYIDSWLDGSLNRFINRWLDGCLNNSVRAWLKWLPDVSLERWLDGCVRGWLDDCNVVGGTLMLTAIAKPHQSHTSSSAAVEYPR